MQKGLSNAIALYKSSLITFKRLEKYDEHINTH